LHGVAAALERALPAMEQDRSFARPSGGTCSLLFYMVERRKSHKPRMLVLLRIG
jgi:hypothetical protein